ncbi:MAG: DUF4191 domain-containing protein [Microbacteriaceae bacterium]|uniref:DUF4191 domain-containing protein n=1 Tax=Leucobacter chinensis TaxID=2851010 RepID=UPI001C21FE81|nr:DUF4191 domain-containing protein [Leucobacter chinensis]
MAKDKKTSAPKEPGRIKQMWQVFQTTRKHDKQLTALVLLSLILPILAGVLVAVLLKGGIASMILWPITGILVGVLLAMIVLGRRAERTAYRQIAGQTGAVGAVIQNALRRGWQGTEMPVAVNPRTQEAIYRVVGRGGIVLITEGSESRMQRLRGDEERKVKRILPNVKVTHLTVGVEEGQVPLERLSRTLVKMPKTLKRAQVTQIQNRLMSLQQNGPMGIPKGIDPMRARAQRPR